MYNMGEEGENNYNETIRSDYIQMKCKRKTF